MAKSSKKKKVIKTVKKERRRVAVRPETKKGPELLGTLSMARDGFGFVTVAEYEEDIFIPYSKMRGALNGDKVRIVVTKRKAASKRLEGEVVKVEERSHRPHIGVLSVRRNQVWAIVESAKMPYDIRIPVEDVAQLPEIGGIKAANGIKVAVLVTDWPKRSLDPIGKIVDVLGVPGENNTEMHAILAEYNLPYRFDSKVEKAAEKISAKITAAEIGRREDFRKVTTFTIDPADAKDFDDALSFRKLKNGHYEVGVHIADVSHYVQPGDIVDKEAYERGTSVYLADRTVPMLPENLCNKLCSLRPAEDKLCFAAIFELDDKAKVVDRRFAKTVINSDMRFDYEEAQKVIMEGKGALAEEIGILHNLATALRNERFAKGAVNFERPEMKVEVDETGKPVNVYQKESKESNWLIEEFMLLANRNVAEFVAKMTSPKKPTFVYRIHEAPNMEKLMRVRSFAKTFGYEMGPTESVKQVSKSLNSLLKASSEKPEGSAIQMLALRAMARARYSTDNVGHYGLAFKYYTHFTSPIRRYPDLMVHRLLAAYMDGAKSQDKDYYEECCVHSSEREQIATDAERASIKYKLVEFMQDKVGKEFEGTISGLTEWGMYMEIEPSKIEGMVAIREMKWDYFSFDEES
ncbi:MAG: ribonuclease R, partial [Bacteroidales bacterium]|nr:ribonuclease R [Bacteroidales bacterium]